MNALSSFCVNGVSSESSIAVDVANLTNKCVNAIAMLKEDLKTAVEDRMRVDPTPISSQRILGI